MSITQLAQSSQTFHEAFHGSYFAVAGAMNGMYLLYNPYRTTLYRNKSSLSNLPHVPGLLSNSCAVVHLSMLVMVILAQSTCRKSQRLFLLPLQCHQSQGLLQGFQAQSVFPFLLFRNTSNPNVNFSLFVP